ncbi:YhfC family intramembrane metalloprotease [Lentibacillus sp. L22]|uniref:YhfC family intramembrane metalloprotease n=1 Tax=Lentibacillus TaxID=175304 RepID=UPI0022B19F9A|nr:YhfC family intramembrane metalloprotease [Lentibacillus daqui]
MGTLSIVFMVISGVLAIGVPVFCAIYFIRKYRISWKPILIGLLVFIVFSQILEKLLHQYVFGVNPYTQEWLTNPYLYALYGCLAAGIFEEVGRYIGFRYFLKNYRDWKDGIAYGIGHGGVEAFFIGGLASISLIINAYMVNSGTLDTLIQTNSGSVAEGLQAGKEQLVNTPAYVYLFTGLERIFAFTHHLGFSLLVLYGVKSQKMKYLLYAILAHAAVDFVATLYQKIHFNIFIVESFNCIVAILAVVFIVKSRSLFTNREI